jgi:formate dehydrogenase subunit gamma
MTPPPEPGPPGHDQPLSRFDAVERVVHWATASLFAVLMATGALLYLGPLSAVIGHRGGVRWVHVYSGLALPVPLLVGIAGRSGRRLRDDLARLNRWTTDEYRWFVPSTLRRDRRPVAVTKFNPGQKLNAAFLAGAAVVMLGTGTVMRWHEPFPVDWRTGATFAHDWFALGIWLSVLGHVAFAAREPDALRAMVAGDVPAAWARSHHPRWYAEQRRPDGRRPERPRPQRPGTASKPG